MDGREGGSEGGSVRLGGLLVMVMCVLDVLCVAICELSCVFLSVRHAGVQACGSPGQPTKTGNTSSNRRFSTNYDLTNANVLDHSPAISRPCVLHITRRDQPLEALSSITLYARATYCFCQLPLTCTTLPLLSRTRDSTTLDSESCSGASGPDSASQRAESLTHRDESAREI
eukprot:1893860-Rhodomonas_salina.2